MGIQGGFIYDSGQTTTTALYRKYLSLNLWGENRGREIIKRISSEKSGRLRSFPDFLIRH
jgi:hypothetical protein